MKRRQLVAELDAWAAGKGFDLAQRPEQPLEIPSSVTGMNLDALGDLYWLVGRWASYVRAELARVEADLSNLKSEEARIKAAAIKKVRSTAKTTVRGMEGGRDALMAEVLTDEKLDEVMTEIQTANGKVLYLNAIFEDVKRATNQISREFARRNIKMEGDFLEQKKQEQHGYGFEE